MTVPIEAALARGNQIRGQLLLNKDAANPNPVHLLAGLEHVTHFSVVLATAIASRRYVVAQASCLWVYLR